MTEWLLRNDLVVQLLALVTLGIGAWMVIRWGKPPAPHAQDLEPMSSAWTRDKALHRKDEHH